MTTGTQSDPTPRFKATDPNTGRESRALALEARHHHDYDTGRIWEASLWFNMPSDFHGKPVIRQFCGLLDAASRETYFGDVLTTEGDHDRLEVIEWTHDGTMLAQLDGPKMHHSFNGLNDFYFIVGNRWEPIETLRARARTITGEGIPVPDWIKARAYIYPDAPIWHIFFGHGEIKSAPYYHDGAWWVDVQAPGQPETRRPDLVRRIEPAEDTHPAKVGKPA